MKNPQERIQELNDLINYHDSLYYDQATSEISDYEYDQLMHELIDWEKQYPMFKFPDSPTNRVSGKPSSKFTQVKHKAPMLSISNCFNEEDLRAFDTRVHSYISGEKPDQLYVTELKLDGVSISLHYEQGVFTRAVTRGDGAEGDDVTTNIKQLRSIPLSIADKNIPSFVEIRGELLMTRDELKRLNVIRESNGEKLLANPRNAAAGTLKQLDPKVFKERKLEIFAYDYYPEPLLRTEILKNLITWGFNVQRDARVHRDIDNVLKYINMWEEKRKELPYDTDGIVVKVNSCRLCERMGFTGHAGRYTIAYKYAPEVVETLLLEISLSVGKAGIVTPIAELEPVQLAGTVVKRASLYNFEQLAQKDLRVGDTILVQKAGEIIPQVIGKVDAKRPNNTVPFEIPTICPSCNSPVEKDPGGVYIRCTNRYCKGKVIQVIADFCSKSAMDIDGIGVSLIEQLYNAGIMKTAADLYKLDDYNLGHLDRMGMKKIENMQTALQESKKQPFERVLMGLNIPNVGKQLSKILAKKYKNIDNLSKAPAYDLTDIPDVGEVVANDIIEWFKDDENKRLIDELKMYGLKFEIDAPKTISEVLKGKSFLATGKLTKYTRDSIEQKILELGGEFSSGVSKNLDYLIVGENAGSKLQKAQKLGVTILTDDDFERMCNES